jgi:ATP-dependent Clp protease protease subunit
VLALRYLKRRALPHKRILTHQGGLIAADTGQKVDYRFVDLIVNDFSGIRPQQRRSAVTGFGGPPAREGDR